jgi:hypothetical protein
MKLRPVFLAGSLLVNASLLAALVLQPSLAPPGFRDFFARGSRSSSAATGTAGTAASAKGADAHAGLWATLHTDDLKDLVARMQAAGFPIWAIRAVVQAEVDARYMARIRALTQPDPDTPFWKPTPSMGMDPKRMADYMQLVGERSKLLRDVLGNFALRDDGDITSVQRRRYGDISTAKIDSVEQINQDYSEMTAQVRAAMNGITLPEDRAKLALLKSEEQADLAAVLTPAELEDYNMRNSTVTTLLRPALALFNATPDEFRAIYNVEQPLSDQLYPTAPLSYNDMMQTRQQLADQLKAALGDQRYADFARSSDRDYQQLAQLEERDNLPPGTALQAYNLRDNLSQESNRIFSDPTLDTDQKRAALQSLAQNTRSQLTATLGPTASDAYIKTANSWLNSVERGGAVTFSANSTSFRSLPPPRRVAPSN